MPLKLAHSAPRPERDPQRYGDHVRGTERKALLAAGGLKPYMRDPAKAEAFVRTVGDAAPFHDLGKLDPENQAALAQGRNGRLKWDHIDAGVAHLMGLGAEGAAWVVRAHHSPGLPSKPEHFPKFLEGLKLRGRRAGEDLDEHQKQIERTDLTLQDLLRSHRAEIEDHVPLPRRADHGLFLRFALSCLVDGDHSDSAFYETGWTAPARPPTCWQARLNKLDAYVAALHKTSPRQADRDAFYKACREGSVEPAMVTCEGPVGIGKTTAVMAWLLRRAIHAKARRIIIVAPFTTILSQTAERLRKALVLEGEDPDVIVAEHHHRADFDGLAYRDLATLWQAPIVLTTSVQFFETLSACEPAQLRKLHALPGSVVCLDEAHAALPAPLWKQNWAWMKELADDWSCSFVFASGSLARVWEQPDIVGPKHVRTLADLAPKGLQSALTRREHDRVRYRSLKRLDNPEDIVRAIRQALGPRLVVLNTVQSAAVIASRLRETGDTLHLSTALCPSDRATILSEVFRRLDPESLYTPDWTLVATSLIEAGVDLSFRTALRERFSTSSLIQIGGRVNRHGRDGLGEVIDFFFDRGAFDSGRALTHHPGAKRSATVLGRLFEEGTLTGSFDPATVVTKALVDELRDLSGTVGEVMFKAEGAGDYPGVAEAGRLITSDTRLVVVKPELRERLEGKERVSSRDLLAGSVQLWSNKIDHFGLQPIRKKPDVSWWPHKYDAEFLGYMEGALGFASGEAFFL